MKILMVYDSIFGNTEKIALAIVEGLGSSDEIATIHAKQATVDMLNGIDLLIVGSPTRGFQASDDTRAFLNSIPGTALKDVKFVTFDTRIALDRIGGGLRFLVKTGGYAANKMVKPFRKKGGTLLIDGEGFLVTEDKVPVLIDGEEERARRFGATIATRLKE